MLAAERYNIAQISEDLLNSVSHELDSKDLGKGLGWQITLGSNAAPPTDILIILSGLTHHCKTTCSLPRPRLSACVCIDPPPRPCVCARASIAIVPWDASVQRVSLCLCASAYVDSPCALVYACVDLGRIFMRATCDNFGRVLRRACTLILPASLCVH